MPPQRRDPDIAAKLVAAAARVLADEGRGALSARRLGAEVGASSMAVYTYFGSMEEVLRAVWRDGFVRFAASQASVPESTDAVADFFTYGAAYRRFAFDNPNLYRVMFDAAGIMDAPTNDDLTLSRSTFDHLVRSVERCVVAGRWHVADTRLASRLIWGSTHGYCMLQLAHCFDAVGGGDPGLDELGVRLCIAFGDDERAARRSLARARRRAHSQFA